MVVGERRERAGPLRALPSCGWAGALAAALCLGGCDPAPDQGTVSADVIADGASRAVSGALSAATLSADGSWVAVESLSLSSSDDDPAPIGPVCLWLRLEGASAGASFDLAAAPMPAAPFDEDRWYCLPGTEAEPLFLGVRCASPEIEETPAPVGPIGVTPVPVDTTPVSVDFPGHADQGQATPTADPQVPMLIAISGTLEVVTPPQAECGEVELKLSGVVFESRACEGPVQALTIEEATVKGTVLLPGRDWATGGYAQCTGALR